MSGAGGGFSKHRKAYIDDFMAEEVVETLL